MRRREFLGALAGAVACPVAARALTPVILPAPATPPKPDAAAGKLHPILQKAQELGAPLAAIRRAMAISRQPVFTRKDALAVFDMSQPSANKRLYLLDFKSGQVTAHHAAHGKTNGAHAKATKFKGFARDLDMVPLGPLKVVPARAEVTAKYATIADRYDKTVYRNMVTGELQGVAPYNRYINSTPPYVWVIHPGWYASAGYRSRNKGMLGRSNGCITLDPAENNKVIPRLQGGLVYVTVGDAPIEQYL